MSTTQFLSPAKESETYRRGRGLTIEVSGHEAVVENIFRIMRAEDQVLFRDFIRSLPRRDNCSYRVLDMHNDRSFDHWVKRVESNQTIGVIALQNERMIGYGGLDVTELPWMIRHTAEIHVSVSLAHRGRGLGRSLANKVLAIARARELGKIWAQIAVSQKAAQRVLQSLGFRIEALLADFIKNADGLTEDLVIMSYVPGSLGVCNGSTNHLI
jgi:ribosomal protein S18 acetylase RimI-like enzyme